MKQITIWGNRPCKHYKKNMCTKGKDVPYYVMAICPFEDNADHQRDCEGYK